ncbi:MAG: hypothetical protein ACFFE2_09100 [Candidatus Thorarchaeota archaeon]
MLLASIDEPPPYMPPPRTKPEGSLAKIAGSGFISICTCICGVSLFIPFMMFIPYGYGPPIEFMMLGLIFIVVSCGTGYICCKGAIESSG